ncbi:MAG TPA: CHAD domain-containing protein [Gemmatimonadaceae bacterium]|nr:CHAD domain-containing protein [Gemmatimonadaceae bacterium]
MPVPSGLLGLPAERATRLVALDLVDALVEMRVHLGHEDEAEALHDFRVALRRLRSWLRAYDETLEGSIGNRLRRRLRRLARATGASRDLEVHLAWLDQQRPGALRREQAGIDLLHEQLVERRHRADQILARAVERSFTRAAHQLRRSLRNYTVVVHLDNGSAPPTFAGTTAELISVHAEALQEHLSTVHSVADETEAHAARIAAKRLRYLLEPLAAETPATLAIVDRLKALQDVLGDLHDAHVFSREVLAVLAEAAGEHARRTTEAVLERSPAASHSRWRDPRPGLIAIGRTLRDRAGVTFAALEKEWLGDRSQQFFAELRGVTAGIAAVGAPPLEIERKYLLSAVPGAATRGECAEIEQGWIPGERVAERLRRVRDTRGEHWYRTVKLGAGITRIEIEEEMSQELFEALWPVTEGRRVHKQRYRVRDGDVVWEIDRFLDRGLVLAEVELRDQSQAPSPPEWLAPHVVREVTGEPEFVNLNLAR